MLSTATLERPRTPPLPPSMGHSGEAQELRERLKLPPSILARPTTFDHILHAPPPPVRANRKVRRSRPQIKLGVSRFSPPKSIARRASECLMGLRLRTSQVAMYLDSDWLEGLDRQLAFMLDASEWPLEAALPTVNSYGSFLNLIVNLRPLKRPSLGVSDAGNIVCTWDADGAYLFVEFYPNNFIRWSAAQRIYDSLETISGQTISARLLANITGFSPSRWFANVD